MCFYVSTLLMLQMAIVFCYRLAMMLSICASLFKRDDVSLRSAARTVFSRFGKVLIGLCIFVLIPIILYFFGNAVLQWMHVSPHDHTQMGYLVVVMAVRFTTMLIY